MLPVGGTYLQSKVLDIVLVLMWGIQGASDVGDVEGLSCKVMQTKHHINLHNCRLSCLQPNLDDKQRHRLTGEPFVKLVP